MRFSILFFILFLRFSAIAQVPVSFYSEYIDFTVDSSKFTVNGIFSFRNKTEHFISQSIIFPFACRTSEIDSIRVLLINKLSVIPFDRIENGISFKINLQPYDSAEVNIFYRQPLAIENRYILTSTASWEAPLQKAVYSLRVPASIAIEQFSYNPDSIHSVNDDILYYWKKEDFMPNKDFIVKIK